MTVELGSAIKVSVRFGHPFYMLLAPHNFVFAGIELKHIARPVVDLVLSIVSVCLSVNPSVNPSVSPKVIYQYRTITSLQLM